jgi:hypothetical protein
VDHDVERAVALPGVVDDPRPASGAVTSSCSAVPPSRFALRARLSPADGMSTPTTGRPVASEHLGDRRADPPSGAGDDGDLAGQRGMPVVRATAGPPEAAPTVTTWPST